MLYIYRLVDQISFLMANRYSSLFFSHRLKIIGLLLLIWAVISFLIRHSKYAIWDFELLCGLICWGLCFIFFAREKVDDERIHHLKFRALAWAVPLGLFLTHLVNYFYLNQGEPDSGKYTRSISAYSSIAMILTIAVGTFYFLKFKENRI